MTRLLLCTDLDRTLLPNGPQPESALARERFQSLVEREEVTLVYVTGRHQMLVQQAIKNFSIPEPDYVIADVGSTIYRIENCHWDYWKQWETEISSDWNNKNYFELAEYLSGFSDLRMQESAKQNTHKLSYYVPLYVDHTKLVKQIKNCLEQYSVNANVIWSVDEPANIGLLDILPARAGKLQAIEFLMYELGFSSGETVFAGDSGNDISVMASYIQAVLVANASMEVKKMAVRCATQNGQRDNLYLAQGGYLGMNGNYSAGIIEGVVHYIPTVEQWININDEY